MSVSITLINSFCINLKVIIIRGHMVLANTDLEIESWSSYNFLDFRFYVCIAI